MRFKRVFRILIVCALITGAARVVVWACGGTPAPPRCFQSAWLAKFVPGTVVFPVGGGPMVVPVGVLPFVSWDAFTPACAQPIAAEVRLTFTCVPAGGGLPVVIGPTTFVTATPTVPGIQPLGPLLFTIPGGTLTPGIPHVCTITGQYRVTFGAGFGAGLVIGLGDTEVCIVPPSPADPSIPRLNLRHLDTTGTGYNVCQRGDQAVVYYLIENNDPTNAVSLTVQGTTNQVARMPLGDDPDSAFFAISSPVLGTDNFPQAFADELVNGALVPESDPTLPDNRLISRPLTLGPYELAVIGIAQRSYGMCADGSCSEGLFKVFGTFDDGSPALGCAGSAYVVGERPPKTPLCVATDAVSSDGNGYAEWSPATFNNIGFYSTLYGGNFSNGPAHGTRTRGSDYAGFTDFPSAKTDFVRIPQPATMVTYSMTGFSFAANFLPQSMQVMIQNLQPGSTIEVPLIAKASQPSNLLVQIFGANAVVTDLTNEMVLYNGLYATLRTTPPPPLSVDNSIKRLFTTFCPPGDTTVMATNPMAISNLFSPGVPAEGQLVDIFDPRNGTPLEWSAASNSGAILLDASSGGAGTAAEVNYNLAQIPTAPSTLIAFVTFGNPVALNSPLLMPVAVRKMPGRSVGDFNDSGCTDLNDFLFLLDNWQTIYQGSLIGIADFLALLDNWQTGPSC